LGENGFWRRKAMSTRELFDRRTAMSDAEAGQGETRPSVRRVAPAVDIFEGEDALTLVADLPGVATGDVKLDVERDVLSISARFLAEKVLPGEAVYSELYPCEYYRAFALGDELDASKISAHMKNGVLELKVPKAERAKTRKIAIASE